MHSLTVRIGYSIKEVTSMSEKKHKSRIVHVDKLIVHADEVVTIPKRHPFDPWFRRPNRSELEDAEGVQGDRKREERKDDDDNRDEKRRNPFSWI
jgi:hypothetical protein